MMRARQRGFSLFGLIFWGSLLGIAFVLGSQVAPVVIEYQAIAKASRKAAREGNSVQEVRSLFDKAAQIDDIKSITGRDLEITKEGDRVVAAFAYSREIHLAGPAYLLLKFSGQGK